MQSAADQRRLLDKDRAGDGCQAADALSQRGLTEVLRPQSFSPVLKIILNVLVKIKQMTLLKQAYMQTKTGTAIA